MPHTGRHAADRVREVETLAWLLDNSIPIPGTGRRVGIDGLIGFVPVVGDLASAGMGLFVVWRGSRLGLPRVVVARMLANSAIDFAVGAIPFLGDAFDLWFKANTRNLRLMHRYLEAPDAPTRPQWIAVAVLIGIVLLVLGVLIWLGVSVLGTEIG
jgi:hypothetical protein